VSETGIADIFETRHERSGVSVASLVAVFRDIWPSSGPMRAATINLSDYEIQWGRDYAWGSRRNAEFSLRRAHAQREKGWLTEQEYLFIEKMCTARLARA
jgi:hypothetical protein